MKIRRFSELIATILMAINVMIALSATGAAGIDKTTSSPSGTMSVGNNILDVHVEDQCGYWGVGTYAIATGSDHPAPSQAVFYGGVEAFLATTYNTIHVVDTMRDYVTMCWGATPDPGYSIEYLDMLSPSTISTPTMITSTWTTFESLEIAQEIELIGTTAADSLVRVTMNASNNDIVAHTIGIRYEWDLMIDGWDGAWIRPWTDSVTPGTWIDTETEWTSPGFQFWETSNMPVSLFSVYGSISSLPDATPPDRLLYAHWGSAVYYAYSYTPTGIVIGATEPTVGGWYDSCMLYYWEPTTINPGETKTVTAYVTTFITAITPISANLDIDPDTLNLRSEGEWVTGYIELPEGYIVEDIDVSSILLNDTIPAETYPVGIGDEDGNGIPDLIVKFDRSEVTSYILANVDIEDRFMTITLTITGTLNDGTPFQGSDTIRILKSKGGPGRSCLLK